MRGAVGRSLARGGSSAASWAHQIAHPTADLHSAPLKTVGGKPLGRLARFGKTAFAGGGPPSPPERPPWPPSSQRGVVGAPTWNAPKLSQRACTTHTRAGQSQQACRAAAKGHGEGHMRGAVGRSLARGGRMPEY